MILKGQQIYLKKGLVEENYPFLLEWFHDLELMRYIGWVKRGLELRNVEELKKFISELEDGIIFGIYDHDDKFIGYTSLSDFRGKEECEFGIFILDKKFWGKGIGLEVTRLMLDYAFNHLTIDKVVLSTSEFHTNATRLYEKAGFKKTNLISNERTIFHNGEWILSGTVEMAIEKQDYGNKKNKYNKEWFSQRALSCLKRIDDNSWDYSDSLLLYSPQGQSAYEVAHDEISPYFQLVTKPELLFLNKVVSNVAKSLPDSFDFFDLGVGVENKERYFFDAFGKKDFTYAPVDVSEYFLSISIKNAKERNIKIRPLQTSFEELPELLKENNQARFVTLLGLTFSNYQPQEILKLLLNVAGKKGYIFFDIQLKERINIEELSKVYNEYVAPACEQKIRLIKLDPKNDISKFSTNEEISIWCEVINCNEYLHQKGIKVGDRIKVFQSLRLTLESLKKELTGLNYEIFDKGDSFIGVLIKPLGQLTKSAAVA